MGWINEIKKGQKPRDTVTLILIPIGCDEPSSNWLSHLPMQQRKKSLLPAPLRRVLQVTWPLPVARV